jgi:hypothetical protein
MDITARALWTILHGMGFGALYLLAFTGALVELRRYAFPADAQAQPHSDRFLALWLLVMAALAWLTVLTGTYILYPWYRAIAPAGTIGPALAAFPQRLLLSSAATAGWHNLGMEWKEHVAWLAPIASTAAAAVFLGYGSDIRRHPLLRRAVLGLLLVALLAAATAGLFGAMLNKFAPIQGGSTLHIPHGDK